MTHSDIYTKFMIEYDKADITSSYPSLTKYEVATILDKAYLALISQKISGNNARKAGFEFDIKAIEDLRGLIKTVTISPNVTTQSATPTPTPTPTSIQYVGWVADTDYTTWDLTTFNTLNNFTSPITTTNPTTGNYLALVTTAPVTTITSSGFPVPYVEVAQANDKYYYCSLEPQIATSWVLNVTCNVSSGTPVPPSTVIVSDNELSYTIPSDFLYYIQSALTGAKQARANVMLQPHEVASNFKMTNINMPWIKTPVAYIESKAIYVLVDYYKYKNVMGSTQMKLTYIHKPSKFVRFSMFDSTEFELQDTMAEELINLAIVFATETTESPRLSTKTSIISYES